MNEEHDPTTKQDTSLYSADIFNQVFSSADKLAYCWPIWMEVYGEDCLPAEVGGYDFSSISEIRRIATELRVGPGQTFVDLACGMGGPGLWVAQETGANVVGIDFSAEAIKLSEKRAGQLGLGEQARYHLANMASTSLPSSAFDGAISIDALQFPLDKVAVLREVGRFLRPGSRFVFTTWEDRLPAEFLGEPPTGKLYDYRPLLSEAGFNVESYEETKDWERRQRGIYLATLAHSDELIQEMGVQVAGPLIDEAKLFTELHDGKDILMQIRRILVVAQRI